MIYPGHPDQKMGHVTYSQNGEDLLILNFCKQLGLEKPSYLDLGAHHPFHISNTALLYERGSRGVNVEANPSLMKDFEIHRPEDKNVNIGIGNKVGMCPFYQVGTTSGINSFCKDKIPSGYPVQEIIYVEMVPVSYILHYYCNEKFPDLLFTDIEGLDLEVLEEIDFSLTRPKLICSEIRIHESTHARAVLFEKGFSEICRVNENMIFVQSELLKYCL